jgi:predicted nucleotidyltransferase
MTLINRDELEEHMGMELPKLKDVRHMLRRNPFSHLKDRVLAAYIVGSTANKTNTSGSDLDIAVIIPARSRTSSLKVTERYHAKFTEDSQVPKWNGITVDLQFFYSDDEEGLNTWNRMEIGKV